MNHLKCEKSPYLLQHANNPVNWYPWCQEAFDEAVRRDVPIFLSIGYSVCHWCHVMAHESFEDAHIAEILNRHFVSVKVDREERPDIDSVYMSACQAMTGSGGWPLTILMAPDKKPFYAATYLPKSTLADLLLAVSDGWQNHRKNLLRQSAAVIEFVNAHASKDFNQDADLTGVTNTAVHNFLYTFDERFGGFGAAPKFPSAHNLLFLLSQGQKKPVDQTLLQMYLGGIFDHIGGGFCRYSTDAKWLIPHFEKMLYDNALLLAAYAEAAKSDGRPLFGEIADRIYIWLTREMTHEQGGFFCSQDADAEGREGSYYVFTPDEIEKALGKQKGQAFCRRYDITDRGNFEGYSIPNLLQADDTDMAEDYILLKLYRYRAARMLLHKDDKILTSWNGLTIAALARSARCLNRQKWLDSALKAADFLWDNLADRDGLLLTRWRDGEAGIPGTLDDYAYYSWGLLECYASTYDVKWLQRAALVTGQLINHFFDWEEGGCYLYAARAEQLFIRPKETYDGAMPSGNSVAFLTLSRLAALTDEDKWQQAAEKQKYFMAAAAKKSPMECSFFLWQFSETLLSPSSFTSRLIITAANSGQANLPKPSDLWPLNLNIIIKTPENSEALAAIIPETARYPVPETGVKYYLCHDHRCMPPADTLKDIKEMLASTH
ncbi:thioredoxin domain-containing protein [Ihubacter sp. rT4E-8]|uniref:thioredoxin domain-containing protein n=1 Tax=unclassified Ihubacter TaxID=2633299 RepID=UPI003C7977AC